MHQARKFFTLSASEQRRIIHTALLIVAFRIGLWLIPYRYLRRLVDRSMRKSCSGGPDMLDRVAHNIVSLARFVPQASCLTQAMTAQVLLRQEGFDPKLQIGVGRDGGGVFKAHAWVECDGRIVVGDFTNGEQSYTMLRGIPQKVA